MTSPPEHGHDRQQPLRVCIAARAPFVGGAELAAERLALGLAEAGHDARVALPQRNEVWQRMHEAGVRLVQLPACTTDAKRPWRFTLARGQWRRFISRFRPHVLHANDIWTHQLVSSAARGGCAARICHHRFPHDGRTIDWLIRFGAERHLFVSDALMRQMCDDSARLEASPRGVLYDGLTLPKLATPYEHDEARRALGVPPHKLLVLYAGQIIERKGVAELIEAFASLGAAWHSKAELVLVGDDLAGRGAYRVEMQALAKRLRCPARFVGFQPSVEPYLRAAHVAMVPSHVEPLGNATLEAMSHAVAVIGCRVGGIPEMVEHEQTGLLCPPRNARALAGALQRLLVDPWLARRMGEAARSRCARLFSLQTHIRNTLTEYRALLSGDAAGARADAQHAAA